MYYLVGAIRVTGKDSVLEFLHVALTDLLYRAGRVLQVALFVAILAPSLEHIAGNLPSASLRGPVDGAVLKVHEAALAIWRLGLAGLREAKPGGWSADFGVASTNAAEEGMRTGVWGPVSGARLEVLGLALLGDVVLIIQARANNAALGLLSDGSDCLTVRTAVGLVHLQCIRDVWPCLLHLKLPVFPAVHARWAELNHRVNLGALRIINIGLGGHTGDDLQAHASEVCLALSHGVGVAKVILARTCGDIYLHVLQVFNAQLWIMVDPVLGARLAPHLAGIITAGIALRSHDGFRHATRSGIEVAGERTHEAKQVRVALSQVHRGSTTHGQAGYRALVVGAVLIVQDRDQFLGQEGLPHIVLTAVCLLPVRVEGRLAAYRHDQVDVAVGVLVQNIGFNGPAGLIITSTQAIQRPYLWELLFWVGVPVTGELDLHLLLFVRHRRGLDVDHQVAVG